MKRLLAIGAVLAAWAASSPVEAMPLGVRVAMWGIAHARDREGDVLSDALDAPELAFATGGDAGWSAQSETAHGGGSALKSGAIGDGQESWVEASVDGAGEVSFWWKASSEHYRQYVIDYALFSVDGQERLRIGGEQDWTNATVRVEGGGTHVLRWTYVKDDEMSGGSDCAWLDAVVWTPGGAGDVVVSIDGTNVTVSGTWLAENTTRAATDTAANGRCKVWECYVLGVDPEDPDDDFRITRFWMDGGKPMFEFSHTRDGSGVSFEPRIRKLGKAALGDAWQVVPSGGNPAFRFFSVEVALP